MATKTINFTKQGDAWETKFTSEGNMVIELEREKWALVSVLANISGLRAVPIASYENAYNPDVILRINVPAGLEVIVKSGSEVKNAKMLVE